MKPDPVDVEHKQILHTLLALTATLKEAVDAFSVADRLGRFSDTLDELK